MSLKYVYAERLIRFLEDFIKEIDESPCWGIQNAAAIGSKIGALEKVLQFVKTNIITSDNGIQFKAMPTLSERDAVLELLWKQFAEVPMDPETEKTEAPFLHLPMNAADYLVSFDAGTTREDIWHWFDERHSKGVVYLLYGRPFYEKDSDETDSLKDFIKQEVPFRLSEIFHIPDTELAPHIIDACVDDLYYNSDVMFNYNSMDAHIRGTLAQYGINPDDYNQ